MTTKFEYMDEVERLRKALKECVEAIELSQVSGDTAFVLHQAKVYALAALKFAPRRSSQDKQLVQLRTNPCGEILLKKDGISNDH